MMQISIEDLLDREAIRAVVYQYCRGIDRLDWGQLFDCFTDNATHEHGDFKGDNDEFRALVDQVIGDADGTLHTVGTIIIDLNGDSANTESSFVAYHRFPGGPEGSAPIPTNGRDTDWIVAGRYVDQFVKTGNGWKIAARKAHHDWIRADPANPK